MEKLRFKALLIAALCAALTACGPDSNPTSGPLMQESAVVDGVFAEPAPAPDAYGGQDRVQREAPGGHGGSDTPAILLAYRYAMGLELPAEAVATLQETHAAACRSAGPRRCQIISAQVNDPDGPRASAFLELRAEPAWLVEFRASLADAAEAAGGRIQSDNTSVEDLTARIVDASARLEARTTLRDRLQTLLETREGDLGELLQVERELARVQEQLDAQASVLAALRQRVDTSTLTLSYQARREIVRSGQFSPIVSALSDVGDVFAESVGALILIAAALAPWLLIGIPVLWLAVRWIRGVFRRRLAKAADGGVAS